MQVKRLGCRWRAYVYRCALTRRSLRIRTSKDTNTHRQSDKHTPHTQTRTHTRTNKYTHNQTNTHPTHTQTNTQTIKQTHRPHPQTRTHKQTNNLTNTQPSSLPPFPNTRVTTVACKLLLPVSPSRWARKGLKCLSMPSRLGHRPMLWDGLLWLNCAGYGYY